MPSERGWEGPAGRAEALDVPGRRRQLLAPLREPVRREVLARRRQALVGLAELVLLAARLHS